MESMLDTFQLWSQESILYIRRSDDLGYDDELVIRHDRFTGEPALNLGQLRGQTAGSVAESFHFVLNNSVVKDNRTPPWGMDSETSRRHNILPVPPDQFDGKPQEDFSYFDVVPLSLPVAATRAKIRLLYQPTIWEYIQFLTLANEGSVVFLKDEGKNLLQAWLHTGMAEPHEMSSTTWTPADCSGVGVNVGSGNWISVDPRSCSASDSITAPGMLGDQGARLTLISSVATLGKGFSVENGVELAVRIAAR